MEDQGRRTEESDWCTSGVATWCGMAITNGNNWLAKMVGDISGRIEEFCLFVEDVVCKDSVNYESKLQKVGVDVRSICLESTQEVLISSLEQVSEEVPSDMPSLETADSYETSDTAEGDNHREGSWSINNYSDVDFESCSDSTERVLINSWSINNNYSDVDSESCGDTTQHVPISQAEAMPFKSEDEHKCASLMEGLGENFNDLDTCADDRSTVKSLYCVSPEDHVSIIPDVTSSNAFEETIELDCSAQETHAVNKSIKLDESCIVVDIGELCLSPNELTEQLPMQNDVLENTTSIARNLEFDESEWEII